MNSRSLGKKLIMEKRMTIVELAYKAGYSYSTARNWLAGQEMSSRTEAAFEKILREVAPEEFQIQQAVG